MYSGNLPYLQLGLPVVAVRYRLSGAAPPPAAVEDCRCAFRWLARNGNKYGMDPQRIVITSGSAGGRLALMLAMLANSFDASCDDEHPAPKAAGVINYYGAADIEHLLGLGLDHVRRWLRRAEDPRFLARSLPPLQWAPATRPVFMTKGAA